ncbi:MAG: hypothetical protein VX346_15445 [Planctomycetota bacterium]|nr:hypothetical protein [Planctomycetota bacterium]
MLRDSKVLKVAMACGLLVSLVIVVWTLMGDSLRAFFQPPLVEVEGQVLINGEPLSQAHIETHPIDTSLPGSSGMSDADGRFRMTTFVENAFRSGVFAGRHQVTVVVEEPGPGGFGVRIRSPEKYASRTSSQLTLSVAGQQPQRAWKIELRGVLKPATSEEQSAAGADPSEGYIVVPLLQQFDINKDQRLGPDEREQIDADMLHGVDIESADTNGDGYVDRNELGKAAQEWFGSEDFDPQLNE